MKKIIYRLISLILMITLCGCKNNNQDGLYQLPNQSYSQMMSYIIEDKGHTIVIDGGTAEDSDYLVSQIKKISSNNTVDAWYLTHYHKDHTDALAKYLLENDNSIKIKNIYYNFPKDKCVEQYEPNRYQDYQTITGALKKFENKHIVHQDDTFEYGDIKIKVLRSYNQNITNNAGNNSSSVYKFNIRKTSILFLGDLGVEGGEELLSNSKNEIENIDYVQMAHHGQAGVTENVYRVINPKYCLWPTPDWLWGNKEKVYKTDETKKWINKLNVKKNYIVKDGLIHITIK